MTGTAKFSVVGPQGAGLELSEQTGAQAWETLTRTAELAQSLGYEDFWLLDRTDTLPRRELEPVLEGWTGLASLAARIPRMGLGQLVPAAPLRNAGILAKQAATLDLISGGRFRLGLSGEPALPEHQAIGIVGPLSWGPQPGRAAERLRAVGETLDALRALWTGKSVTRDGEWVHLDEAHSVPVPVAERLPVAVRAQAGPLPEAPGQDAGGFAGLPDDLVAGVDTVQWTGDPVQVGAAIRRFAEQREALGLDPAGVRHAVALECRVFDSQSERDRWLTTPNLVVFWSHHPDLLAQRNLYGTAERVTERAGRYLDAGVEEFVLWFRDYPQTTSLERFAAEVAPALGSRVPS